MVMQQSYLICNAQAFVLLKQSLMHYKNTLLFLALCLVMSSALSGEDNRVIQLAYAIAIGKAEDVVSLLYKCEPLDTETKKLLMDKAQDAIMSRHNEMTTLYIDHQDDAEFRTYSQWHSHTSGIWLLILVGAWGIASRIYNINRIDRRRFYNPSIFMSEYRDWIYLDLCMIGYYINKRIDNRMKREFLKKKLCDSVTIKDIILKAQTIHSSPVASTIKAFK